MSTLKIRTLESAPEASKQQIIRNYTKHIDNTCVDKVFEQFAWTK